MFVVTARTIMKTETDYELFLNNINGLVNRSGHTINYTKIMVHPVYLFFIRQNQIYEKITNCK